MHRCVDHMIKSSNLLADISLRKVNNSCFNKHTHHAGKLFQSKPNHYLINYMSVFFSAIIYNTTSQKSYESVSFSSKLLKIFTTSNQSLSLECSTKRFLFDFSCKQTLILAKEPIDKYSRRLFTHRKQIVDKMPNNYGC